MYHQGMPVLANVGTPLMWAGVLHLFLGNALLGVLEGLGVAWLLGVRRLVAIPALVAANYLSAWVGAYVIGRGVHPLLAGVTIHDAFLAIGLGVAGFFLATVMLEWPLVHMLVRRRVRALRRSLFACAAAQAATYLLLILWYGASSSVTLLTETERDETLAFLADRTEVLTFEGLDGVRYRMPLRGGDPVAVPPPPPGTCEEPPEDDGDAGSAWTVTKSGWFGLRLRNESTGEALTLGMETPFFTWTLREATVLAGDLLIFQAKDQILALDLGTRRLGLVARGIAPVVTPPEGDSPLGFTR